MDIYIYGGIGAEVTSRAVVAQLAAAPTEAATVRINSHGGSLIEGVAIYNALQRHAGEVTVEIDGGAISAASVIAMAGGVIRMAENALLMIHNPNSAVEGDASELRSRLALLDRATTSTVNAYVTRTKIAAETIRGMMDEETWLSAQEALQLGFIDEITGETAIAAFFEPKTNDQSQLENLTMAEDKKPETKTEPVAASYQEIVTACTGADDSFICSQLKANSTVEQCRDNWVVELALRNETAAAEIAKLKEAQAKADAAVKAEATAGIDPVDEGGKVDATDDDPIAVFNSAVADYVKAGHPKHKAVSMAVKADKQRHVDYLAAVNG